MNKEPRPKSFWLEIGGQRLICTPENTQAYLYEDPTFDHIFHITSVTRDGIMNGYHIWRPMVGNEGFDNLVKFMINNQYEVESLTEPDNNDRQAFVNKYGEPEKPKLLEPHDITPRQEHVVEFLHYLLENEKLAIEDFNGEGDLRI